MASMVIRTVYGDTSESRYKISKKYTQVGSASDSDLVLREDGLPNVVCLLEKSSDETVLIHCQASNVARLGKKMLGKKEVAIWKLNEEIDVCGSVVLRLENDVKEKRSSRQQEKSDSYGPSAVSSGASIRTYSRSQTRITNQERTYRTIDGSLTEIDKTETVEVAEKEEKKENNNGQLIGGLLLLGIAAIMFILINVSKKAPADSATSHAIELSEFEYILDSTGKNVDEPYFSFQDSSMADDFRNLYWLERNNPYLASLGYRNLSERLYVNYSAKKRETADQTSKKPWDSFSDEEKKKVEEEMAEITRSYVAADRFVQNRIDKVKKELDESK